MSANFPNFNAVNHFRESIEEATYTALLSRFRVTVQVPNLPLPISIFGKLDRLVVAPIGIGIDHIWETLKGMIIADNPNQTLLDFARGDEAGRAPRYLKSAWPA